MKTIKLLLCIVLLGLSTINAQENMSSNIKFGIKGGVNYSKFKGADTKNKIGFVVGFYAKKNVSDKFSLQSELLYSTLGAKLKIDNSKIKLNFISIPFVLRFHPMDKFSIEGGTKLGYLLSGKGNGFKKKNFKKIDYGLVVGLGYQISDNMGIGIRYYRGLSNMSKISNTSLKNSALQLSLSINL
jgi:opacity protein-like surface antigen